MCTVLHREYVSIATTMVRTRLDYCNAIAYLCTFLYDFNTIYIIYIVWHPSKSNIHKLQRVQKFIARVVTGTTGSEHITPVLARLHWLKMCNMVDACRQYMDACDRIALMNFASGFSERNQSNTDTKLGRVSRPHILSAMSICYRCISSRLYIVRDGVVTFCKFTPEW